jgi:ubiquinol-cytochrome c reductase cytochrome b subunit
MAKAGGFFFMVFGVTALMGALLTINPVWKFGPYDPSKVTAGSQPDWYMGIAEGLLRIMPNWETTIWGHTISWNVMIPGQVAPFLLFGMVIGWPFLEAWVTGDKREHHLLQRPRNAPFRTSFLVMMISVYGLLWAAGGNDILATKLHLSLNSITYFMRAAVFIVPPILFFLTWVWCIGLQRADRDRLLHGYETGIIMRSPEGAYTERHLPINEVEAYTLTARQRDQIYTPELETDENGVRAPGSRADHVRARMSRTMFEHNIQKPTVEELDEAHAHAAHEHELEAGLDHPASGHEFDDHQLRDAGDVPLRGH